MSDGLSMLQQQRAKATSAARKANASARHLPPPRHASARDSAAESEQAVASEVEITPRAARTPRAASSPIDAAAGASSLNASEKRARPAAPTSQLVRATIYLGDADDEWLEDIASSGRRHKPRIDASRSAVTRLALERLREELSTEQVVEILAGRAAASTQAVGRKRL